MNLHSKFLLTRASGNSHWQESVLRLVTTRATAGRGKLVQHHPYLTKKIPVLGMDRKISHYGSPGHCGIPSGAADPINVVGKYVSLGGKKKGTPRCVL